MRPALRTLSALTSVPTTALFFGAGLTASPACGKDGTKQVSVHGAAVRGLRLAASDPAGGSPELEGHDAPDHGRPRPRGPHRRRARCAGARW